MEILYLIGIVAFWLFKAYSDSKKKQKATEQRRAEEEKGERTIERQEEYSTEEREPSPRSTPSFEDILKELTGVEEEPVSEPVEIKQEEIERPVGVEKPKFEELTREVNRPLFDTKYKVPKVHYKSSDSALKSISSQENQIKQDDLLRKRDDKRSKKSKKSSSIQYFLKKDFNLKHAIVAQAILDAPYIKD